MILFANLSVYIIGIRWAQSAQSWMQSWQIARSCALRSVVDDFLGLLRREDSIVGHLMIVDALLFLFPVWTASIHDSGRLENIADCRA